MGTWPCCSAPPGCWRPGDELPGTVRLAFQPGEEGFAGAKVMLNEGVLNEGLTSPVSAAFAIHVTPNAPTGFVAMRPGPLMASADEFTVTVKGRGTHASMPHFGIVRCRRPRWSGHCRRW